MNIADIVGPVDVFSAAVVIGFGAAVTIMVVTGLARTPRKKMEFEFELAKMKQNHDADSAKQQHEVNREVKLGQIAANKQIEVSRIENGMVDVNAVRSRGQSGGDGDG